MWCHVILHFSSPSQSLVQSLIKYMMRRRTRTRIRTNDVVRPQYHLLKVSSILTHTRTHAHIHTQSHVTHTTRTHIHTLYTPHTYKHTTHITHVHTHSLTHTHTCTHTHTTHTYTTHTKSWNKYICIIWITGLKPNRHFLQPAINLLEDVAEELNLKQRVLAL